MSHPYTGDCISEMRSTLPEFGRFSQMQIYICIGEPPSDGRNSQMELKKNLIGEYTGSLAPSGKGSALLVRNRTRIYESEKGHLSYVITEYVIDQKRSLTRRETYVGLITGQAHSPEAGVFHLHLSPLGRPYRGGIHSGVTSFSMRTSVRIFSCSTGGNVRSKSGFE
jgi:hypothetical protein